MSPSRMRCSTLGLCVGLLLAGCGGNDSQTGGNGGSSGSAGSAGSAGVGGEGATSGAGGSGGAAGSCSEGTRFSAEFGPLGGALEGCGAKLEIDPNILPANTEVSLTVVALEAAPPGGLEQAGLAFELEAAGDVPPADKPPLHLWLPHAETQNYLYFFRRTTDWEGIEACEVTEQQIAQRVAVEGTYVALVSSESFPESRQGLGSGTLTESFRGESHSYDLDSGEFDTYAIYDEGGDGSRGYVLSATQPDGNGGTRLLRLNFSQAGDAWSFNEVTAGDLNGLYGYLPFDTSIPAEITVDSLSGTSLRGQFSVEVNLGDDKQLLEGTFDVSVEKYRYPPEGVCWDLEG